MATLNRTPTTFKAPYHPITSLKKASSEKAKLQTLLDFSKFIMSELRRLESRINNIDATTSVTNIFKEEIELTEISTGARVSGLAGAGLAPGMVCYQSGSEWFPCDPSDNTKFATAVCIGITNELREDFVRFPLPDGTLPDPVVTQIPLALIQLGGLAQLTTSDTPSPGSVLYPHSTVLGLVTTDKPTLGTDKFWQEIGVTVHPKGRDGKVITFVNMRLEPEKM